MQETGAYLKKTFFGNSVVCATPYPTKCKQESGLKVTYGPIMKYVERKTECSKGKH